LSSIKEKNLRLRSAAIIHVEITPTVPSAFGLSRLSPIRDKRDYPQNHIIFKNYQTA